MKNPYIKDVEGRSWQFADTRVAPNGVKYGVTTDKIVNKVKHEGVYDGVIFKNIVDVGAFRRNLNGASDIATDYVSFPGRAKLRDAVTYDNNGVRIPLGERDNFNINDIRYAIAPILAGGIGYGAYRNQKASGGYIHIAPSKRGTFTAAASKHGMGVQEFANRVLANKENYSPAMVKKANFARNASKWKHKEFGGDMDFNYWITKDNIYKLGGRKKGVLGLSNIIDVASDIVDTTKKQVNKSIIDKINPISGNIGNLIGTGINIDGNLISYGINNRALNRMRRPSMPLPLRAENLQDHVSTAAQEAAIRENVAGQEGLISGNLASSRSRLNAVNRVRNQGTSMYNQLQDRKQNIETELINRNKLNRQQIGNQNVLQFNNWKDRVTEFDNRITDLRSENGVNLTQGIADAIAGERGYLANRENDARYRMNAFLTTIANPDAFKAMNSAEIKRLARQFGITNRQLKDLGINV